MQPNTIDLTKILKVGDKVYSDKRGCGEVYRNDKDWNHYPLTILFENSTTRRSYNKFGFADEGCIMHELYPSSALESWQEPCPFEKGELVWVSDLPSDWWVVARFFEKDGDLYRVKIGSNYSSSYRHIRPFSDCPLPLKIDVK